MQSGYTQTREVSLFSWSTCSKGNAVHEFPLGDASFDVIVTCPINSPVGSNHLKHSNRALLLPGPTLLFYERETVSRDSPSSFIASLPRSHTCNSCPPRSQYCVISSLVVVILRRHHKKVSFCNHVSFLPSFLSSYVLIRPNEQLETIFCMFDEFLI